MQAVTSACVSRPDAVSRRGVRPRTVARAAASRRYVTRNTPTRPTRNNIPAWTQAAGSFETGSSSRRRTDDSDADVHRAPQNADLRTTSFADGDVGYEAFKNRHLNLWLAVMEPGNQYIFRWLKTGSGNRGMQS